MGPRLGSAAREQLCGILNNILSFPVRRRGEVGIYFDDNWNRVCHSASDPNGFLRLAGEISSNFTTEDDDDDDAQDGHLTSKRLLRSRFSI